MSHFIGLCFGENWENDIERYDENRRVDRARVRKISLRPIED